MSTQLVNRINSRIDAFEATICKLRRSMSPEAPVASKINTRLESYEDVIVRQRYFALCLEESLIQNNEQEAKRNATLINAMCQMVKEDIECLLANLQGQQKIDPVFKNYC